MSRILITSGPTRQYLDPVRYLTNASSGRMGKALADVALEQGHEVVIVSGPVEVKYAPQAQVIDVVSTEEMLEAAKSAFEHCDGVIGVAAPCDYRPQHVADQKLAKTGGPLMLELVETADVIATLGAQKGPRWVVGFALETEDHRFRAITKAARKNCDLMVLNSPSAMHAVDTEVELIRADGTLEGKFVGSKQQVSKQLFEVIERELIA